MPKLSTKTTKKEATKVSQQKAEFDLPVMVTTELGIHPSPMPSKKRKARVVISSSPEVEVIKTLPIEDRTHNQQVEEALGVTNNDQSNSLKKIQDHFLMFFRRKRFKTEKAIAMSSSHSEAVQKEVKPVTRKMLSEDSDELPEVADLIAFFKNAKKRSKNLKVAAKESNLGYDLVMESSAPTP
ncbi:hypothetical protein L208DRAFT_1381106 [Tricholoma matsutake]|nr:hypothetical protein L208DRAFT_1381106 [Tricholoma matsutake 945]